MVKTCALCGIDKPLSEYTPRKMRGRVYAMAYCKPCYAAYARSRRALNPDIHRQAGKKFRREHTEEIRSAQAKWREENKLLGLSLTSAWRKRNRGKLNEYNTRRHVARKQATPPWANQFFMEEAYRLASLRTKVLGYNWDVDHIVPLKHKLVCGLHVHNNLRVIPAVENRSKGNRYWPGMP